ncbi:MAG: murein biosynthesis integral membrane protein MurJ [Actinomycetota bacterium]|nr:murein biosynthesis integral membrane protein MurJ [Actinomycetota bacterium]
MSAGTLLSRATGLLRYAAIAYAIGIAETRLTDSYNLANSVPNILYETVLGGVLASVFVPVFVELLERDGRDRAWEVMSGIVNFSMVLLTAISAIGIAAAPLIAKFYSSRLGGSEAALQEHVITFLVRLFIPQIIFYALYFILAGILNAHRRFVAPAFTPALNNVAVISVFIAFHAAYGTVGLEDISRGQLVLIGAGTTLGVVLAAVSLLPFLKGISRYRLTLDVSHPSVRKLLKLSVFSIGLIVTNQIGFLILQYLSNAEKGAFSAYLVAFTFFLLPQGLFGVSINTALLPDMSRQALNENWDAYRASISTGVRSLIFLVLPTSVGYILLAPAIVRVLLEHGVMQAHSTHLVSVVLQILSLSLVPFTLFQFFLRGFYALQDTRSPFIVNGLSVALAVTINSIAFHFFAVQGLAAGNAIAYTFASAALGTWLARRVHGLDLRRIVASGTRIAAASAAMGVVVWIAARATDGLIDAASIFEQAAGLSVPVLLGAVVYLGAASLMRVEELDFLRGLLRRRTPAAPAPGDQ